MRVCTFTHPHGFGGRANPTLSLCRFCFAQVDLSGGALIKPTTANHKARVNAISSIHFPKQAEQVLRSVNDRVRRMFPATDDSGSYDASGPGATEDVPSFALLLTRLLTPASGSHGKFVGHLLTLFNTKGPLIFKEAWDEVVPKEVYSFIRLLLAAGAGMCSLSDVYNHPL